MPHLLTQAQQKEQVADLSLYVDPSASTMTGTNTSAVTKKLIDSGGGFSSLKPRQVVVNTTDHTATIIDYVEDDTTLVLKNHIFTATSKGYSIDNNAGTSGDKFKYPQSAMEAVPETIGFYLHVYLADGTYSEIGTSDIVLGRATVSDAFLYINKKMAAGGRIIIEGNTTTPANVHFNGTTPSAAAGVLIQNAQKVEVGGLKVSNCTYGITAEENSSFRLYDVIATDCTYGISLFDDSDGQGWRLISGQSGTGNTYGVYMERGYFYVSDESVGSSSSSLRYNGYNIYLKTSRIKVIGNATANVNLSDSTNQGVFATEGSSLEFDRITVDSAGAAGIEITFESSGSVANSTISNNTAQGILAFNNSVIYSDTNTGAGSTYGLSAQNGSVISKNSTQPTGTVSNEQTVNGGAIY